MKQEMWSATAPSNIALIKYMGKKDVALNLPDNPSLSYTLPHLVTKVEIEKSDLNEDLWEPLKEEGFFDLSLGPKESARYLKHFLFLKEKFEIKGFFKVRSANNFPENCGLASSASSFAALTKAASNAFCELSGRDPLTPLEMGGLSRLGSGSSCRSFLEPWCVWSDETIFKMEFPYKNLIHMVVMSDGERKKVSSSQAHKNVQSSLLYENREERATLRMGLLTQALGNQNWKQAFELCWAEFWDMHALFETSNPSFGYMNEGTFAVLKFAKAIWRQIDDGPLVTMDAGPNVHLLFRTEQSEMAKSLKAKCEALNLKVYSRGV